MATGKIKNKDLITKEFESGSITLTQNQYKNVTINVEVSGYTPLGVVGITFPSTAIFVCNRYAFNLAKTTLTVDVSNTFPAERTSAVAVTVLYQKN